MIRLLVFLVIATALAFGAVWLAERPGSVTIEWLGTVYQTRVDVALLVLLLFVITAILAFELLQWLRFLPGRVAQANRHKKQIKGYQSLIGGLVAVAAGDSRKAKALKQDASRLLGKDPKTLLLNAQTAQLDGDDEVAEIAYRRMLKSTETSLLGLRGLLSQAVKDGDYDDAAKLAQSAYDKSPTTDWVLNTYFDILARRRSWRQALKLIDEMARAKTQTEGELAHKRAVLNHMIGSGHAEAGNNQEALPFFRKAVKLCPDFAPAAVLGANVALKAGRIRIGRRMLEDAWAVEPHPELANAFAGLIKAEGPKDRDRRWRRLQDLRPSHVETHITLADVALHNGDKPAARRHAEAAVQKEATVRAYQALVRVERDTAAAPDIIEDLRQKVTNAEPDPGWVCQDTNEMVPEWQPFGLSGRFDAIVWTKPPRVSALLRLAGPDYIASRDDSDSGATKAEIVKPPVTRTPAEKTPAPVDP